MKSFFITIALLFSANIWALNCSVPNTLSDSNYDAFGSDICANRHGDAAVLWEVEDQRYHDTIAAAYKIKNSTWSSPEFILEWDKRISLETSFIAPNGDLFAVWENRYPRSFQTAGKKLGESWTSPLNMFASDDEAEVVFDSSGRIICAVERKIETTIPPVYSWEITRKKDIPALAIAAWSQDQTEQDWGTFSDVDSYYISEKTIASNQNGLTHIFWFSHSSSGTLLMGQKMQNGQFISEAETIYHKTKSDSIYKLKSSINKKGDVALAWIGRDDSLNILTNFDNTWSEPFIIAKEEEGLYRPQVLIDNKGNIMVTYAAKFDDLGCVAAVYKPYGQPWMAPVLFTDPDHDSYSPQIKSDLKGNFVLIWEKERRNRSSIYGTTFSTAEQKWASPQLLSPKGQSCFDCSFVFWKPGKGYISWTTTLNGFDTSVQVADLLN